MAYKINGVSIVETLKVNNYTILPSDNKINGVSFNICYEYTVNNENPPMPPIPITFNYTMCDGTPNSTDVFPGGQDIICAIVDTVNVPPGGSSTKGSSCT